MGTSTIDRMAGPRWLRWFRAAGGSSSSPSGQSRQLEELMSELALLREENARLKVQQERPRERPVNERVRELLPLGDEAPQSADSDEPWELLTDCLMLRDGLVDACREIEEGMRETRRRLDAILPEGGRGEPVMPLRSDEFESVA
jgi:hypothetical protein